MITIFQVSCLFHLWKQFIILVSLPNSAGSADVYSVLPEQSFVVIRIFISLTTGWTTGWSGFDLRQGQRISPLASVSRPALGPTQPPVQWVSGILSLGVKRGRGVTLTTHPHLVPRSWMSRSYTSSPPSSNFYNSARRNIPEYIFIFVVVRTWNLAWSLQFNMFVAFTRLRPSG
jgi:hypothetical protein